MMKHILQIIICAGISLKMFSQNNCNNSVITNWSGPVNNALPYTTTSPSTPDSKLLNAFNWTSTNPIQLSNMQYNQQMVSLKNPQQLQYYSYIYNGEELSPENGWELLLFNIGTYPNLDSNPNGELPDLPYIVLYNRYTGIVRVFANYGNGFLPTGISFDAVKVILTFDGLTVNGTLRLQEGKDKSLDQQTNITQIVSLAKHPNAPGKWFSTDFQVTYDPCICYFPSDMRINFEFITSESLELHGREINIEQDLINGTALETKDYLSNFDYTGNTAEGGMIMYRTIDALVADYEAKLIEYKAKLEEVNEHNEKINRNLAVIKLFKHVVLQGGNSVISEIGSMPWIGEVVEFANDLIGDTVVTKQQIINEAKNGFSKEVNQFFAKNFEAKPLPTSPSTPSASFSEMHFKGNIQNETTIAGPNFYTPGTYGSEGTGTPLVPSALQYPVYNDAFGVFALLNKPKIKISKTIPIDNQVNFVSQNTNTSNTGSYLVQLYRYQTWSKFYQFQLAEDLKYAINSKLDVKNCKVEAAFNIKAVPKDLGKPSSVILNSYHNPVNNVNFESTNTDISTNAPIISNDRTIGYYQTPVFSETYYNQEKNKMTESKIYNDTVLIQTPFLPIDAFQPLVAGMGIRNEAMNYYENFFWDYDLYKYNHYIDNTGKYVWDLNDPDLIKPVQALPSSNGFEYDFIIELKLIVDIEFNTLRSDGTPNSITQIHTFDVASEDITWLINDIVPNLASSNDNISQYPQNINFSTTNFQGQEVEGCMLVGSTYTCQAWNNIKIYGNISATNGYNAKLKAGNEIYVLGESIVSPETELSIFPILDYSHPMPKVDGTYVQQFCMGTLGGNSPTYHANVSTKSVLDMTNNGTSNQETINSDNGELNLNWLLVPNPANGKVTIILSEPIDGYNITVSDLTGKKHGYVLSVLESNLVELQFDNAQKGIFLVTIKTQNGTQTKRLILQ